MSRFDPERMNDRREACWRLAFGAAVFIVCIALGLAGPRLWETWQINRQIRAYYWAEPDDDCQAYAEALVRRGARALGPVARAALDEAFLARRGRPAACDPETRAAALDDAEWFEAVLVCLLEDKAAPGDPTSPDPRRRLGEVAARLARQPATVARAYCRAKLHEEWWLRDLVDPPDALTIQQAAALLLVRDPRGRGLRELTSFLDDGAVEVRREAVTLLDWLGNPRAGEALLRALDDEDGKVRRFAAATLGNLREPRAAGPLTELLRDADGDVRLAAAAALWQLRDGRAVLAPAEALNDEDWRVRRSAAETLGRLGGRGAAAPLARALADANEGVRRAAAAAREQLRDGWAVEPLMAALAGDALPEVRAQVAAALGALGDRRAVRLLLAVLAGDAVPEVRAQAATALGTLGDRRAVRELADAFGDESFQVRHAAAAALGRLGGPDAFAALLPALRHTWPGTRRAAAQALAELTGRDFGENPAAWRNWWTESLLRAAPDGRTASATFAAGTP